MVRLLNRMLELLFGVTADGDRNVYLHWQNLNERSDGTAGFPFHGRAWLRFGPRRTLRWEWNLWSNFCGVQVGPDREDGGLMLSFSFPPFAFWLHLPIGTRQRRSWDEFDFQFISLRVFDKALWWQFFADGNARRGWRRGCLHPLDVVFGRSSMSERVISTQDVAIPMPEGSYPAKVRLTECTWKRPRLPFRSHRDVYASVDLAVGIPHEGKGENAWDCGTDALHGLSTKASTVEQAIAKTVESALKSRRRYDGNVMAKYPAPVAAA